VALRDAVLAGVHLDLAGAVRLAESLGATVT
jgi:hypothetical protein